MRPPMPYASVEDLPPAVRRLPVREREIWRAAFNSAYREHGEEGAFRIAWAAARRAVAKHSDHDQSDHGNWATDTGGDGATVAESRAVAEVEARIRTLPTERLVAVDSAGRSVIDKGGDVNSVRFTSDEVQRIRSSIGVVATHNHPSGGSFSRDDLIFAIRTQVDEIRVVGKLGGHDVYYSASPPTIGRWPGEKAMVEAFSKADADTFDALSEALERGEITRDFANQVHDHRVLSTLSDQGVIRYETNADEILTERAVAA